LKNRELITYVGKKKGIHDQRLIKALENYVDVSEIYLEERKSFPLSTKEFLKSSLVLAGPLIETLEAIPLDLSAPIIGISHAFDVNIDFPNSTKLHYLERYEAIICDCNYVRDSLISNYQFTHPIHVVPYGCDFDFFSSVKINYAGNPRILVTRNWYKNYNNSLVLNAIYRMNSSLKELKCTFIGDGPLLRDSLDLYKFPENNPAISYLGKRSSEEIAIEMSKNWIYISASSTDGSSVSLLEAMAAGMVCIVTDFPSNLEWITDGVNGFTFANGDLESLVRLINKVSAFSIDRRHEIGALARRKVLECGDWRLNQNDFVSKVLSFVNRPF